MNITEKSINLQKLRATKRLREKFTWSLNTNLFITSCNTAFSFWLKKQGFRLPCGFLELPLSKPQHLFYERLFELALANQQTSKFVDDKHQIFGSKGILEIEKLIDPEGDTLLCTFFPLKMEGDESDFDKAFEQLLNGLNNEKKSWTWAVDNKLILTHLSKNAEKVTGYRNETRIGKHLFDKRNSAEQKRLQKMWDSYVKRPRPFHGIHSTIGSRSGEVIHINAFGLPHYDDMGNLTGYSGIAVDVTEELAIRNEIQKSESLHRAVVNALPETICLLTPEGNIEFCNYKSEKNPIDLPVNYKGQNIGKILMKRNARFLLTPIPRALESNKIISLNISLSVKGEMRDFEVRYIPMEESENKVLAVFRDITESKEIQAELIKTLNDLYLSNRELEQFAYTVSHDLQEPMRLVGSYLQLIKMKNADQLDEKSLTYFDHAIKSSDQMRMLVSNLLEYSRLGHQKLKITKIDFEQLMDSLELIFAKKLSDKNGEIKVGKVPEFVCDSLHFSLLLQNLISNAIKFAKPDVPPTIEITGKERDNYTEICVSDNGRGMESKYAKQIFGAFERLNDTAHIEGHGLGMSICRKIVDSHGGEIWIESERNVGTRVCFTMPKNKSQVPDHE